VPERIRRQLPGTFAEEWTTNEFRAQYPVSSSRERGFRCVWNSAALGLAFEIYRKFVEHLYCAPSRVAHDRIPPSLCERGCGVLLTDGRIVVIDKNREDLPDNWMWLNQPDVGTWMAAISFYPGLEIRYVSTTGILSATSGHTAKVCSWRSAE